MTDLRKPFLIFGVSYQLQGEPSDVRLVRVHDGLTVAYFGKAWSPRAVVAEATHDARVFTGRVRPAPSPLMALLTALLLMVSVASGAWAKGKHDVPAPTDKPGPTIPVSVTADYDVQASWAWWIAWAGYLEVGPFASMQECLRVLRPMPVRYRCVPIRD